MIAIYCVVVTRLRSTKDLADYFAYGFATLGLRIHIAPSSLVMPELEISLVMVTNVL
jgi:hypothetical protein